MSFLPYAQVVREYAKRRDLVYESVVSRTALYLPAPCRMTGFTMETLEAWQATWGGRTSSHGIGGWDWPRIMRRYIRRPDSLQVAMWSGPMLCGLVGGEPSKARHRLRLEWVEGYPGDHPLRGHILDLAVAAAEDYAAVLGAETLRVMNPVEDLVDTYQQRYRFGAVRQEGRSTYCERSL